MGCTEGGVAKMKVFRLLVICGLGGFFLLAGALKLVDPVEFARAILRYQLVGEQLAWTGALFVPWTEIVVAAGLFFKNWRTASCWLLFALLLFFEAILLSALIRGLDIDCGCLGTNTSSSVSFALMRNIVLAALVLFVMKSESSGSEEN